jgi:hypothetical protein
VLPVVIRLDVAALGRTVQAPLSGWDLGFSGIHEWYRE